jgi:alpha-1,3-rhamnosyl/mannosyltransferase
MTRHRGGRHTAGFGDTSMTLRVAADARCLNTNFVRGMGEYLSPLATHLSATRDIEWLFFGNRPDLPFHPPAGVGQSKVILRDVPGDRFHIWEQVALPGEALAYHAQVLHCTATTLPLWQPVPTVVTIHDTIPWDTGEFLPEGSYRDRLLPLALRRCAKVITISEHSRMDILRLWPNLSDKVRIIRHGLADRFLNTTPAPLRPTLEAVGIRTPYLLYFGGTAARKRLAWTLEFYRALGHVNVDLVVCGVSEDAHASYRQQVAPELREHVVFAPFLAAEDMPSLYQNALVVLYPTLYEGFGVPPLNAQAVGTPVIFSDVSSLSEMVGPTSVALEPNDTNAWIEACRAVIDRRIAGAVPDTASQQWAAQFSWRNSADAHWEVYREAAARGRRIG